MNHFAGFTVPVAGGHYAMLRFAEDGQAEPVLEDGGKPRLFPTELEAQKAVTDHLLAYFNGRLRRDGETLSTARDAAERIFRKGRMIPVEHR
ncbi:MULTISPECIES: hypothetical protein [unclassified Mesorhizobium]|uniref:hypothetical protein n=2 Tax=unclassified Mesorhizobium TaxID=325217 RepID=UPI000F760272|nr:MULTISPECIES: hypothetical protein [unclassified Mesorhizobium]AZO61741.1 hypothetical protein EJ078_22610 [Mesorhizobium sp. M1A.F.Ca.IN.022.06.1.1]MCT2580539.1 hypothetical protein [Mesorhizobium sp. P13.3]MDF3169481.1 hypothetical protein [Mesorhizobium sp. P16.1]MDF3178857.1 hypothetical protein [Mesorhizobium sp. P17.1]MDF3186396.1 hypothetical protein [Mesorhizobium sp. ICCV3110.1]